MLAQDADGKIPDVPLTPLQSGSCDEASTRTFTLEPVGQRLGAYTIVSLLGAGGMGRVYRAHDPVLERDVALKTLPPGFINDRARLERFHNEAKVLASLNHPKIGAIYGFEQKDGISFLVLELVEGEILADSRSTTRTWPLDQILRMLAEIADGRDAAHRKGIIHRDIKPSNIKITPERRVKVLDFGLAQVAANARSSDSQSSESGRIAGTPAYMSPEQIRGRPLDSRSDIWSFGCMVFELLAGERPFRGDGVNGLATAILQKEPRWQALPGSIPPKLTDLVRRCLEKEPARRPSSMAEVRVAIDEILTSSTGAGPHDVAGKKRMTYAGLTIAAVALLVAAISLVMRAPRTQAIHSVAVLPFVNVSGRADLQYLPDGFTEGIIDRLSRLPNLKLMSRSAVFGVRDSRSNLMEAGRKLRVDSSGAQSKISAGASVQSWSRPNFGVSRMTTRKTWMLIVFTFRADTNCPSHAAG